MNVLSLFDGMSCGQIALDRAGIKIDNYYASEIDKYAIKVTQANYPSTKQLGDVQFVTGQQFTEVGGIDLLIGGSPCQGFSFSGKQLNFADPRSRLFFELVRLNRELNPKHWMLENVKMKKEYQDIISGYLGVEPIEINSARVSAQNRKRLYWTNIPGITQPEDKGVSLIDIIQNVSDIDESMYYKEKSIEYMMRGNEKWQQAGNCRMDRYLQSEKNKKSFTLTANMHKGVPYNFCKFTKGGAVRGRYLIDGKRQDKTGMSVAGKTTQRLEIRDDNKTNTITTVQKDSVVVNNGGFRKLTPIECERLQTVPDNYTNHVSNSQRYKMLGNGWTVDVIVHILKHIKS